jgi:hypothetical protein
VTDSLSARSVMDFPVTRCVCTGVTGGGSVLLCSHRHEFDVRADGVL